MSDDVIGVIPAAGKGLRMGLPHPKELFPIMDGGRYKPVSQFALESLMAAGVLHVVFVINSSKHQLLDHFGNGHRYGCNLSYVVQEARANDQGSSSPGLAEALDAAYHLVRGKQVLFAMADTIIRPVDIFARGRQLSNEGSDLTAILFRTSHPEECGMVDMDAANNIRRIVDKPVSTDLTLMWGALMWQSSFTEHLHCCVRESKQCDFAAIINSAVQSGLRVRGVYLNGSRYLDIGARNVVAELDGVTS